MRKLSISPEKAQRYLVVTAANDHRARVILRWIASVKAAKDYLTAHEFKAQMTACWDFAKKSLSGVTTLLDIIQTSIEGPQETPINPEIEDDPNDLDLSNLPASRKSWVSSLPAHMQADMVETLVNDDARRDMPLRFYIGTDADPVLWSEIEDRQDVLGRDMTAAQFLASCTCPFAMRLLAAEFDVDPQTCEDVRKATKGMTDTDALAFMRSEGIAFDSYILTEITR